MLTLLAAMALGATVALLAARISLGLSRSMFDSYLQTARTLVEQSALETRTAGSLAELAKQVEKLDVSFGKLYLMMVSSPVPGGVSTAPARQQASQHGEGPPAPMSARTNPFPAPPPLPPEGALVDRLPDPPGTKAPSVGQQARAKGFAEPT